MELTTLYSAEACLVIYSPDEQPPVVWPSHDEVQRLIEKFYQAPEFERIKKMMNLETYMKEKISKLQDQLKKMNRKNMELEAGKFMLQIHQGNSSNTTACGTTAAAAFTTEDLEIGNCFLVVLKGRSISVLGNSNIMKGDALELPPDGGLGSLKKRREYYQRFPSSSATPAQGYVPLPPPYQSPATTDQIGDAKAMVRGGASSSISSGGGASRTTIWWCWRPKPCTSPPLQGPSFGASSSVVAEKGPLRHPFSEGCQEPSGGSSSASPFMIFEFPNTDIDLPEGDNLVLFGVWRSRCGARTLPFRTTRKQLPCKSSVVKAAAAAAAVVPQAVVFELLP
ncbi:hypothetical protein CXB51_024395 [Gossypium anomalum]|uniref:Uncharacterized protein n=1 Tax=Gossypium anomalum TaxID=47600 RepID=A0A8J5YUG2_9ROSI|nr:hypothetical protein CXB51_024395 [Gossypium anomalum]